MSVIDLCSVTANYMAVVAIIIVRKGPAGANGECRSKGMEYQEIAVDLVWLFPIFCHVCGPQTTFRDGEG